MHFIKSRSTQGRPTLEHASSMVHPCRIRNFAQPSCESHSIESTTTSLVLNLNSLCNDHIFSYLYIGSTRILRKGRGNPKEESQFLVEPRPSYIVASLIVSKPLWNYKSSFDCLCLAGMFIRLGALEIERVHLWKVIVVRRRLELWSRFEAEIECVTRGITSPTLSLLRFIEYLNRM
jgi:hypothetical protein